MRKGGSTSVPDEAETSAANSVTTSAKAGSPAADEVGHPPEARRVTRRAAAPPDLDDEGGAVFEVPFEAFFDAPAETSSDAPRETRRATQRDARHEESTPQADRFERTSTSRLSRNSRKTEASSKQRPERSLKGRALGYLSRREHSRAELSRKLMSFTENAGELEALLDALEREGWLSDARFAESVVYRRAARVGAGRIVSELKRHAVGDALIEEVNEQLRETELARARAVWQKKYGQLPETPAERARQARFLAARGFSMSIIGKILKGIEDSFGAE
jgi:regulatory protein